MNIFSKSLLASSIILITAPVLAESDNTPKVYGKLNVGALYNSYEDYDATSAVKDYASRFGIKGSYTATPGIDVVYQIEVGAGLGSGTPNARNQFVGLKNKALGTIMIGRIDTAAKDAMGGIDIFDSTVGDVSYLWNGDIRSSQTIKYVSADIQNFRLVANYVTNEASTQDVQHIDDTRKRDGYSVALIYGDKSFKKTPVYASIAYEENVGSPGKTDLDSLIRAGIQAKIGKIIIGGAYTQQKNVVDTVGGPSNIENLTKSSGRDGYLFNAALPINNLILKVQYSELEDYGDIITLGTDYKLSKSTTIQATFASRSVDKGDDAAEEAENTALVNERASAAWGDKQFEGNFFGLNVVHVF